MRAKLKSLLTNTQGSIAPLAGVLVLPLAFVAGVTIELAGLYSSNTSVQTELDALALHATTELVKLQDRDEAVRKEEVEEIIAQGFKRIQTESLPTYVVSKNHEIDYENNSITLDISYYREATLLKAVGYNAHNGKASVSASGEPKGQPVCVLALSTNATTGISFSGGGEMKAKDCVVWSNSASALSLAFLGKGKVKSERLCAVGRAGDVGLYKAEPMPESNCRHVPDPLQHWIPPAAGACMPGFDGSLITDTITQLQPGTYCGGLRVESNKIELEQGEYIITGGPLILRGKSKIEGKDGVGIFLTDNDSYFEIEGKSKVELNALKTGKMAGIVIAGRGNTAGMTAQNIQNMLNTASDGKNKNKAEDISCVDFINTPPPEENGKGLGRGKKSTGDDAVNEEATTEVRGSCISGKSDLKIGGVIYLPYQSLVYTGDSNTRAQSPVTTLIADTINIDAKSFLEVKNSKKEDEDNYAPVITTGATVTLTR